MSFNRHHVMSDAPEYFICQNRECGRPLTIEQRGSRLKYCQKKCAPYAFLEGELATERMRDPWRNRE